jgi:FKBP-type peptidyl-prolyl cis-trans isomerase FklB
MNPKWFAIVIMFFAVLTAIAQEQPSTTPKTPGAAALSEKDKISYGVGVQAGKNYRKINEDIGLELNIDAVAKGLKDAYSGAALQVSDEELKTLMTEWSKQVKQKQDEKLEAISKKNKEEGEKWLVNNKVKEGVMVLPNSGGVQYKIIEKGDGPVPTEKDTVVIGYVGKMINDKVFADKKDKPEPVPLSKLKVEGLKAALTKMQVHSHWEVYIPSEQAYGERGNGPIEPNMVVIFDVELNDVIKEQDSSAPAPSTTPSPTPN